MKISDLIGIIALILVVSLVGGSIWYVVQTKEQQDDFEVENIKSFQEYCGERNLTYTNLFWSTSHKFVIECSQMREQKYEGLKTWNEKTIEKSYYSIKKWGIEEWE